MAARRTVTTAELKRRKALEAEADALLKAAKGNTTKVKTKFKPATVKGHQLVDPATLKAAGRVARSAYNKTLNRELRNQLMPEIKTAGLERIERYGIELPAPQPDGLRPIRYTAELAYAVCRCIAMGVPIKDFIHLPTMPGPMTVYRWRRENQVFQLAWEQAWEDWSELMAEEAMEIANNSDNDTVTSEDGKQWGNHANVARAKLRVDTMFKLMAARNRPRFGDKIHQEVTGLNGAPLSSELDLSKMSDAEIQKALAIAAKLISDSGPAANGDVIDAD